MVCGWGSMASQSGVAQELHRGSGRCLAEQKRAATEVTHVLGDDKPLGGVAPVFARLLGRVGAAQVTIAGQETREGPDRLPEGAVKGDVE